MSNHQKRLSVPNSWPVGRKTATFTVKADAGPHGESGVPLLIVLRDVLGYVDSEKEARFALDQGSVLINGEPVSDVGRPVGMFDILTFEERAEYYRVFPDEGGRLALTPIDADAAGSRLGKVVGKQHVPGGDVQVTLHDGTNLRIDGDADTNDSLIVDNETKEIVARFPYEEGALVTAVDGQHAGEIGEVESINVVRGSDPNTVTIEQDGGGFETIEEYVVVIDENFVGDDGPEGDDNDAAAAGGTEDDGDEGADGGTEADGDEGADGGTEDDGEGGTEDGANADEEGGDDE